MKSQPRVGALFHSKKSQAGIEGMMVVSALLLILLTVGVYSYFVEQQLAIYSQEVEYFKSCSELQTALISSSLIDSEFKIMFLHNMTVNGTLKAAYFKDYPLVCSLIVPANGSIVTPSNFDPPVNVTRFISKNGVTNITWGLM